MAEIENRLAGMESRLDRLEQLIQSMAAKDGRAQPEAKAEILPDAGSLGAVVSSTDSAAVMQPSPAKNSAIRPVHQESVSITNILGWTGATALVLAAAYLIRLAIDSGWLTPERQLVLAIMGGLLLIATGLWLRKADSNYASLLPAGGLVVLFMSIYGAHNYYHLIAANLATSAVVLTCFGALWLGRLFESEIYALFAVVGSYSAPFLLPNLAGSVTDLVVYYSAWSVLFSIYSVWVGQRRIYLLAAYMALIGFNALWSQLHSGEWIAALVFQAVQFLVFLGAAIVFSISRDSPLDKNTAVAHLPLLLIFYALQYGLLNQHLPGMAPWIATISATCLLAGYLFARRVMNAELESGGVLVGAYVSLVLFHAGYLESVPDMWEPWVALMLLPLTAAYLVARGPGAGVVWPVRLAIGLVFAINYLRVLANANLDVVPGHDLLTLIYAAQLYAGYYYARRMPALKDFVNPLLYAGHIALMGAAVHLFDSRLAVSFSWGGLAISCLAISLSRQDKVLGKSSLLIFAASAAKVLLFDLSDAAPLVRIACLLVLGVTLYGGGWLYRKVDAMDDPV